LNYSDFKSILQTDLSRYTEVCSWSALLRCYVIHPGFRFTCWFRFAGYCRGHRILRYLSKCATLMVLHQSLKTGIQINPGATIGAGLYIPHYGGIVANPQTVIGKNCYLSHNVLIGKVHAGKREGVPSIGNDVFIGAGTVLLGNIAIGNNAAIGVNSVVIDDVPDHAFVAGSPATVRHLKGASALLGH
jgi:serine O-acetyltransferase